MIRNIANWERVIRFFIALFFFIFLGLIHHSWWGLVGLYPLATSLTGYCPVYHLLGISTYKPKKKS